MSNIKLRTQNDLVCHNFLLRSPLILIILGCVGVSPASLEQPLQDLKKDFIRGELTETLLKETLAREAWIGHGSISKG